MAAQKRSKRGNCLTMMLAAEEKAILRAAADKAAMPLSTYVRTLALMALKSGETLAIVRAKA